MSEERVMEVAGTPTVPVPAGRFRMGSTGFDPEEGRCSRSTWPCSRSTCTP